MGEREHLRLQSNTPRLLRLPARKCRPRAFDSGVDIHVELFDQSSLPGEGKNPLTRQVVFHPGDGIGRM